MLPVQAVAKFIIQESDRISNLKLQKLLYYVQGWHLGLKDTQIFKEDIQAWVHGPVVPEMFQEYRRFGWQTIATPEQTVTLPVADARHIKSVLRVYSKYAADELERLSHTEKPWLTARGTLPLSAPSTAVITPRSMREFFASRAKA